MPFSPLTLKPIAPLSLDKPGHAHRAPPLAGRPPYATDEDEEDEPVSFYETPRHPIRPPHIQTQMPVSPMRLQGQGQIQPPMTPTQRIRAQMVLPAATANSAEREKRTSAYDVYNDYLSASASASPNPSTSRSRTLTPTTPTNNDPFATPLDANANRNSGIGALLMNMSDSESECDSEDENEVEKRGTMTMNTLRTGAGAGGGTSKNAALAAAVSGGGKSPMAVSFMLPGDSRQKQQENQQQQQQQMAMKIAAPQPGYAAPIAALNLGHAFGQGQNPFEPGQGQGSSQGQGQSRGQGQGQGQSQGQAGQSRNPFNPGLSSMPQPQPQQTRMPQPQPQMSRMPQPQPQMAQMPHPHPQTRQNQNPAGRNIPIPAPLRIPPPQHQHQNPFEPYLHTPSSPFSFRSDTPSQSQSPHPLLPPVTPITPAFIRPAKSPSMSSSGSGGSGGAKGIPPPAAIKFDERMVVPVKGDGVARPRNAASREGEEGNRRGEKGDDFWRRFSMVAKHEHSSPGGRPINPNNPSKERESSWLATTQASTSRYTRWVWAVSILLILGIIGGIGCGVYFTRGSPDHQQPKTLGGSADQVATFSSTVGGAGTGTGTAARTSTMLWVTPTRTIARRGLPTEVPVPPVLAVVDKHHLHLRRLEKRRW